MSNADFTDEITVYISHVCEAILMIQGSGGWGSWLQGIDVDSDLILEISELVYQRGVHGTDLYEYFMHYDYLEDLWQYDVLEDDDRY